MLTNSIAIMQPYFFPNLAYYRLVHGAELFVFFDDVHFINKGWINRNQILQHHQAQPFRIPLKEASQNKLINEIDIFEKEKTMANFKQTIVHAYSRAPHFKSVMSMMETVFFQPSTRIADLAEASIRNVFSYLNLPLDAVNASTVACNRQTPGKAGRLIDLAKCFGKTNYVNAIGGKDLYSKPEFESHGVNLYFLKAYQPAYKQFKEPFVPGLSMIDVLMFNEPDIIRNMLKQSELE